MIVAELSLIPVGVGASVSKYVKAALREIEDSGLNVERGAMSTTIEAENLSTLLKAVEKAHEAVFTAGAKRVVTSIKIDERRDKKLSIKSKINALK